LKNFIVLLSIAVALWLNSSLAVEAKPKFQPASKGSLIKVFITTGLTKNVLRKVARVTMCTWVGQGMGNGKLAQPGYVAVSDRSIKFGTVIRMADQRFVVGAYTHKRIQQMSLDKGCDLTVDIYTDKGVETAIQWGARRKTIFVYPMEAKRSKRKLLTGTVLLALAENK